MCAAFTLIEDLDHTLEPRLQLARIGSAFCCLTQLSDVVVQLHNPFDLQHACEELFVLGDFQKYFIAVESFSHLTDVALGRFQMKFGMNHRATFVAMIASPLSPRLTGRSGNERVRAN